MKNLEIKSYWDWSEFGFCFKFCKLDYHPDYCYQFDIHLLFLDIWINFKKKQL